jgi:hypothetical protein
MLKSNHMRFELSLTDNPKPDGCPGDKDLLNCAASSFALEGAADLLSFDIEQGHFIEIPGQRKNHLLYLSQECGDCALRCSVNLIIEGSTPTDVRLVYEGPGRIT